MLGLASFDKLIVAVGRKPNTADISDESFPIELDELGRVQVDDFCKTNYENIYAVGDNGLILHWNGEDWKPVEQ